MPVFRGQPRVRFRATEAEVLLEPFQLHIGLDVDAVSCELQIERAIKKNGQHEQLAATLTRIRDYAAAGTASLFFRLMFGEAMAFQGIEIDNLARIAGPSLLSLLNGEQAKNIHRLLPELTPAPSLKLLDHGVTFASTSRSAS